MFSKIKYSYDSNYIPIVVREQNRITIKKAEACSDGFQFKSASSDGISKAKLKVLRKLPTKWKDTFVANIDHKFDFYPCDAVGILVPNPDEVVDELFELCGFENMTAVIERVGISPFLFTGSIKDFIKYKLDLNTLPKKSLLMRLARNSSKNKELEYICSKIGTSDYLALGENWTSLIEIIREFECKPTLEDFLVNCELIKPRYYTILNSKGDILVGIVSKIVDNSLRLGHFSNFLCNLHSLSSGEAEVEICLRKNKLCDKIPLDNLVCFCTGTGIAPYIAFHNHLKDKSQETVYRGSTKLVYGFRNDEDNILKYFEIDGPIINVKSSNKDYVYDKTGIIQDCLPGCCVFICGNIRAQKATFLKISEKFPMLVQEKRIFFDSWQ